MGDDRKNEMEDPSSRHDSSEGWGDEVRVETLKGGSFNL